MKSLRFFLVAFVCASCALFTPKNERTALDPVQTACIIAHASSDDATVTTICGIEDAILPVLRDLLSEQRTQLAREKRKVGGVFSNGGGGGAPDPVDLASTHVTGVLPVANGGVPANTQWYSHVAAGSAYTPNAGYAGYPAAVWYTFRSAATITGVRFYCSGASQTYKVHAWRAASPGAASTDLGTCTTASVATGTHTCTFSSPIAISDLVKTYGASAYGTANTASCAIPSVVGGTLFVVPCVSSLGPCAIGPNLRVQHNLHIGTQNSDTAPTSNAGDSNFAAVEFIFTVP